MIYPTYPQQLAVLSQQIDQEIVLHDPRTGKVYMLNPTASLIWSLCDGMHSTAEIAKEIQNRFRLTPETILTTVEKTVAELKEYGLIKLLAKE
ncbi:HPr-rel-A system PqqD family peptide chaperone [Beggiatoa leptomitoformis]|uniref:HPr-rel-A system PqqD family peptide chaperone n=1 Tax=Beggiatoa leptomitoformis TaxID=288004 RepID=A0A2N9Y9Z0_9GAMM|nr:HPr-rel-A system PqqD family peptide chaperone [Beggiatoa leptomitoformis]ALG67298.1 HPr-rel-A system PqqD family peptide chaperone [Beggiatoa leptomitoformis]AUI67270.1 HPr-rel-A system PqqD family peptide chaperone [Beggiatoa leptomitoformis]